MELCPPVHLGVVAIEKGAFGSPSTTIGNFTLLIYGRDVTVKKYKRQYFKSA